MAEPTQRSAILKSSFGVAAATFLSRVLGLVRVMLEGRVLGGGTFASAWHLSFSIPNLFRRLLGEGALGNALIPIIAERYEKHGQEQVRRDLAVIFTVLGLLLAGIAIVISGGAILLREISGTEYFSRLFAFFATERMQLTLRILPLLMPYVIFICLIGIIGAVLNTRKIFFLPALGALLLNVFLISALSFAFVKKFDLEDLSSLLELLSGMVLLSGLIQLLLLLFLLKKCGIFPTWKTVEKYKADFSILAQLFKLALPGMIGGAALQVSFLVDELLAVSLGPQALPAISNVNRIIDLPIGIFAISLGSVLMSQLANAAAKGDYHEIEESLVFSLRHVYFIAVPMALAVIFFHEPMLKVMLLGGNYTMSDLNATKLVAVFYGAGIPAFCALKVITPAFYARKEVKKPFYVSLVCIVCNLTLNVILMQFIAQAGIALATVISSLLNNTLLLILLKREGFALQIKSLSWAFCRNALLALISGMGLYFFYRKIETVFPNQFCLAIGLLGILGAMGIGYLLLSFLCRVPECKEILQVFLHRKQKKI